MASSPEQGHVIYICVPLAVLISDPVHLELDKHVSHKCLPSAVRSLLAWLHLSHAGKLYSKDILYKEFIAGSKPVGIPVWEVTAADCCAYGRLYMQAFPHQRRKKFEYLWKEEKLWQ